MAAAEAAWRLFEFDMNGSSHAVTRLAVRLPQENLVYFRPGEEVGALQRAAAQATTLTTWFTFNAGLEPGSSFQDVLYHDMPLYCTWNVATRLWRKRKRGPLPCPHVVGRMATLGPTEGERHYLYLLFLAVPGVTSFEQLRSLGDRVYSSFQSAALARGLYDSDAHYHDALKQVLRTATAARARAFFALMLACCDITNPFGSISVLHRRYSNPLELWEKFKASLAEDYSLRLLVPLNFDAALIAIQ